MKRDFSSLIERNRLSTSVGLIAGLLVAVFTTIWLLSGGEAETAQPEKTPPAPVAPTMAEDPAGMGLEEFRGRIEPNMPFVTAMLGAGIARPVADTIQKHLTDVDFNFRMCRPGQTFTAQVDSAGLLYAFRYDSDRLHSYWIRRDSTFHLHASTWETPVETELLSIEGDVHTSVYQTILSMGEKPQLVADYVDVLGYDIDFIFDPRVGDHFRILVEKHMLGDDIVGYGAILAAEYEGALTGRVTGYRYDAGEKDGPGYFAPDGENLQKAFMRSPLSILRVTSGYGMRTHPISGKRKMHTGIDYAAPHGTPVWAVGSGTVAFAGRKGGYGNTIEIQHSGAVKTRYGHLSKIFVRRGQSVHQHQTIGAVGSTGYSTGPHLHFEYLVHGKFTQPRKVKNPSLKRLSEEQMPPFQAEMQRIDSVWQYTPRRVGSAPRNAIAGARSPGELKSSPSENDRLRQAPKMRPDNEKASRSGEKQHS
ncbi:M23 family metallopeptidase [bacterium]|nr:M23 family metallopeptidase [bacterium]